MLCFRCEHRAQYLETGRAPRYECGQVKLSKQTCYMYKPCFPIVTYKQNEEDLRPEHGGYFGCRMTASHVVKDCELNLSKRGFLYWTPAKEKKGEEDEQ